MLRDLDTALGQAISRRRDQTYRDTPLGQEVTEYLRHKSKRLTEKSYRGYERTLALFAVQHPTLELDDLEPPAGTRIVEDFLARNWAHRNPKTYNVNLTTISDFCKWHGRRGTLKGDPTLAIERAKPRQFHRSTFSEQQRLAILASSRDIRYRLSLRLLLDYGIRKGALAAVRLEHFDEHRQRLTIFTKGESIHQVPIPDPGFWADLAALRDDPASSPSDYLMCKHHVRHTRKTADDLLTTLRDQIDAAVATADRIEELGAEGAAWLLREKLVDVEQLASRPGLIGERIFGLTPSEPLGEHGIHSWWYRRLSCAGVVVPGTTRGQRMHGARHTAGQRVLDLTGNLVAVQHLLGHKSVKTTGDNYVGHETDQLHETMRKVLAC